MTLKTSLFTRKEIIHMKNKHALLIVVICTLFFNLVPTSSALAQCSNDISYNDKKIVFAQKSNGEVQPTSSNIVWKYKVIDGVLYKRKYDTTLKKWIGDWIKVE